MPSGVYQRRGPAANRIPDHLVLQIREMILSHDFTLTDIAKKLGVGRTTVKDYQKRLGLPQLGHIPRAPKWIDAEHMECRHCKTPRLNDEFLWESNERKDRRQRICKYCVYAQTNRRLANLEPFLKYKAATLKSTSKRDDLSFNLSWSYLGELLEYQQRCCLYTGVELVWGRGSRQSDSRVRCTLDKIEPNKGYVVGNVVWCSRRANLVKQDLTLDEMREWMPVWWEKIQLFKKEHDEHCRLAGYYASGEVCHGEVNCEEGASAIALGDLQLHAALPV